MTHVDTQAIWLGHPGHLVALPDPSPGVETFRTQHVAVHVGVSGGRIVDVTGSGLRTFRYSYSRLTEDEANLIDQFHSGAHGCGPWALIDPVYPNRFDASQSSGGSACGGARGFAVAEPDRVEVDTRCAHHGRASILWSFNPQTMRHLAMPSRWPALPGREGVRAFPIIPNAPVNLAAYVRPEAVTWVGWSPRFFDACGDELESPQAAPVAAAPGCWQPVLAQRIIPPADAAWIAPRLSAVTVAPRVCDPARVRVDTLSMTYGRSTSTSGSRLEVPRPGAGVPQVEISNWTQTIPHLGHIDGELELVEVCGEVETQ
ncbi:MAG: hypothetical protein ACRDXX_03855 [Stackebrandtia sp.]